MKKVASLDQLVSTAVVAVSSTKGGAGKSTTVAHLAMEAARRGLKTLVIDCDEAQTSIYVWAKALRDDPAPVVRLGTAETIAARIAEGQREGFGIIIIDTPPGIDKLVTRVANLAEHIIVPVRVTAFDLHALRHTVDLLQMASDGSMPPEQRKLNALEKAVLVLNALPADAGEAFMDDVYGAIIACGGGDIEIIANLCDRRAYATTLAKGVGVTEHRRDRAAAAEIEELFANLQERIAARQMEVHKLEAHKTGVPKAISNEPIFNEPNVYEAAGQKLPRSNRTSVKRKGTR